GGEPIRTRVGHSYIKEVMAETGAVFGGEHSGHYYFRDHYNADSGLVASMVVMDQMSKAGKPLSEMLAPLRRYSDSGEINREFADYKTVSVRISKSHLEDRLAWICHLIVQSDDME